MNFYNRRVPRAVCPQGGVETGTYVIWRLVCSSWVAQRYFGVPVWQQWMIPVNILPIKPRVSIPRVVENMHVVIWRRKIFILSISIKDAHNLFLPHLFDHAGLWYDVTLSNTISLPFLRKDVKSKAPHQDPVIWRQAFQNDQDEQGQYGQGETYFAPKPRHSLGKQAHSTDSNPDSRPVLLLASVS